MPNLVSDLKGTSKLVWCTVGCESKNKCQKICVVKKRLDYVLKGKSKFQIGCLDTIEH